MIDLFKPWSYNPFLWVYSLPSTSSNKEERSASESDLEAIRQRLIALEKNDLGQEKVSQAVQSLNKRVKVLEEKITTLLEDRAVVWQEISGIPDLVERSELVAMERKMSQQDSDKVKREDLASLEQKIVLLEQRAEAPLLDLSDKRDVLVALEEKIDRLEKRVNSPKKSKKSSQG